MAATERFKRCKYCDQRFDPERYLRSGGNSHHPRACPMSTGLLGGPDQTKLSEWERGYRYGFEDNYIQPYHLGNYSLSFCLGYELGKNEINRQVERAVARNYGYEYDDYDDE